MTCCKCNAMLLAIEAIYIPGRRGGEKNNKLSAAAQQTTRRIQSVKHLAAHYEYLKKKIQLKNLKYLRSFCENMRKSRTKLFGCCYNAISQLHTLNIVSNIKSSIDFLVHIVAFQKCHWHMNEY